MNVKERPKPALRVERGPRRASFPHVFKSRYYHEKVEWDADVKVDWDRQNNPIRLRDLRALRDYLLSRRVSPTRVRVYRTRKGWHLRLWTVRKLGPYEALNAQAAAGDDEMRQRFNLRRVRRKEEGWNVLFNEKYRNGRLIYREELDESWQQRAEKVLGSFSLPTQDGSPSTATRSVTTNIGSSPKAPRSDSKKRRSSAGRR